METTALQLIHRVHASENVHDTDAILQSFDNHEEAHWQISYSSHGDGHERAAFYLMGYVIYMFTYFPYNHFLKPTTVSYYLDVLVKNTKEQKVIAKRFNAKLVDVMYAEDENTRQFRFNEVKDVINYLKFKHQV
jgi:hypothetical protein